MYYIASHLVKLIAPILSFTAEDVWQNFFKDKEGVESVFLTEYEEPSKEWENKEVREKFDTILKVREHVLKGLEVSRREKLINSSLEAKVILEIKDENIKKVLEEYSSDLWELFIVSQVEISTVGSSILKNEEEGIKVGVVKAEGQKCERCWIYSPTVGKDEKHPTICSKCLEAIE